jgi:hypothetical protein
MHAAKRQKLALDLPGRIRVTSSCASLAKYGRHTPRHETLRDE